MRQPTKTRFASLGAAVAVVGTLACGRAEPAADVVAEVDGDAVPYAEFESYLAANAIVDAPSLGSEVLSGLFDQFLDELLLARLAAEEGFDSASRRLAVSQLISGSSRPVERAEAEAYFRAHPERFRREQRVRLRQILVEERSKAELALRELTAGSSFDDVARRISEGPRAKQGGDQGILARGDLPPEIAKQIFDLAEGAVSEIVPAEYGFHIFQITQRFPESTMPFDEAYPEIVEELEEANRHQNVRVLRERAVKRYNVSVFARNLPFRYQGKYA